MPQKVYAKTCLLCWTSTEARKGRVFLGSLIRNCFTTWLSQGIAVVEPNVRGSVGYGKTYTHLDDVEKRLDSVEDVACLIDHLVGRNRHSRSPEGRRDGGELRRIHDAELRRADAGAAVLCGMHRWDGLISSHFWKTRPITAARIVRVNTVRSRGIGQTLYDVSPIAKVDDITGPLMIIHGKK